MGSARFLPTEPKCDSITPLHSSAPSPTTPGFWQNILAQSRHGGGQAHQTKFATTSSVLAIFGESHLDVLCPNMGIPDAVGFRRTCVVSRVFGAGRYDRADPQWSDLPPHLGMCERSPSRRSYGCCRRIAVSHCRCKGRLTLASLIGVAALYVYRTSGINCVRARPFPASET
jgi:hypothetical protein